MAAEFEAGQGDVQTEEPSSILRKAGVFILFQAPLAAVTLPHDAFLLLPGVAVSGGLAWSTMQVPKASQPFDEAAEKEAMGKLVTTTPFNRASRIGLFVVYAVACVRLASIASDKSTLWQVVDFVRLLLGCYIGLTWLSSGYYGQ